MTISFINHPPNVRLFIMIFGKIFKNVFINRNFFSSSTLNFLTLDLKIKILTLQI